MPKPPDIPDTEGFKFVTNYLLSGCTPPVDLIVEFSQEPAGDLLALFYEFSAWDIVQAMFEPKNQRRRRPARHGRKRRPSLGIPDPNDVVGSRLRNGYVVEAFEKLPGYRIAYRLNNAWEGINFAAAFIEGIEDLGYETLWGILDVYPEHCQEFPRLFKHNPNTVTYGGVFPDPGALRIDVVDENNGFFEAPFGTRHEGGAYAIALSALLNHDSQPEGSGGRLCIFDVHENILGQSQRVHIEEGEFRHLSVSCVVPDNRDVFWGWCDFYGFTRFIDLQIVCYGKSGWMDWTGL